MQTAPETITKAETARRLGVTAARVSQLTAPGAKLAEAVTPEGKIDWEKAQALHQLRADPTKSQRPLVGMAADTTGDDAAFKAARARKMAADAEMAEKQLAELRGDLCRTVEVDRRVSDLFRDLRDKVTGLTIRMAQRTMSLPTERERAVMIEEEIERVFAEFADGLDSGDH